MLRFEERDDVTVQNPPAGEVILFYTDGAFRIKDSAGEVTTITTVEGLEEVAEATEPKVYIALLTQSGTNAPVATVLKNTLGGTVVWTYDNVGRYVGTLVGAFTNNKTWLLVSSLNNSDAEAAAISYSFLRVSDDVVSLKSANNGIGFFTDELIVSLPIKIEVYP